MRDRCMSNLLRWVPAVRRTTWPATRSDARRRRTVPCEQARPEPESSAAGTCAQLAHLGATGAGALLHEGSHEVEDLVGDAGGARRVELPGEAADVVAAEHAVLRE